MEAEERAARRASLIAELGEQVAALDEHTVAQTVEVTMLRHEVQVEREKRRSLTLVVVALVLVAIALAGLGISNRFVLSEVRETNDRLAECTTPSTNPSDPHDCYDNFVKAIGN